MLASLIAESLRGILTLNIQSTHVSSSSENSAIKVPREAAAAAVTADAESETEEGAAAQLSARSRETLATALERLRRAGPWQLEACAAARANASADANAAEIDAVVESCRLPGRPGKIFRLTATLPGCRPERVWETLREDCAKASWLLADATSLQSLDEGRAGASDVQLQMSAPRLGGLVASREFLLVRRWCALPGGAFALVSASTDHKAAPAPSWRTPRAACGPGGWLLEPAPAGAGEGAAAPGGGTRMRWVVDCAPGGWLPTRVSDAASTAYMLGYAADLHARCRQPRASAAAASASTVASTA